MANGPTGADYPLTNPKILSRFLGPLQTDTWEEFADMFVGWTYGTWSTGGAGTQRSNFMNHHMPMWVNLAGN
jgi:hypothetical protein